MKLLTENIDYKLLDSIPLQEGQGVPVWIMNESYAGVIIQYGEIDIEWEDENPHLKFEYVVHENPLNHNVNSEEFDAFLGDLLVNLTISKTNSSLQEFNDFDHPIYRTDNSEKFIEK